MILLYNLYPSDRRAYLSAIYSWTVEMFSDSDSIRRTACMCSGHDACNENWSIILEHMRTNNDSANYPKQCVRMCVHTRV